ncbi:MAG: SUMF1/EgtB/PvdO family nonheme iron enzyme [Planctomycetota bacterium]
MLLTATLRERLETAWERTDGLFALLRPEAWPLRPGEGQPCFLAVLGELPGYAWQQVGRLVLAAEPLDPELEDLYCRPLAGLLDERTWPAVEPVHAWRDRVRDSVRQAFESLPEHAVGSGLTRGGRVFYAVLEHELLAHERLLAMLAQLERGLWRRPADLPAPSFASGATRLPMRVPAGSAVLGARPETLAFGWDVEFPSCPVDVPAFEIDSTPVVVGEFLDFVLAGGYRDSSLWTAEGWTWIQREQREHPQGWRREAGEWRLASVHGDLPLQRVFDWPVSVSYAEAQAFARRERRRLPTEAEFHRAAYGSPEGGLRSWPWGEALPSFRHGNFDWKNWSPTPVGSHPAGCSAWGVHDLVGNGWEWTSSAFSKLPRHLPSMPETPGPCEDAAQETHQVLLGGSWATDRDVLRRSFRNAARRTDPHRFTSFRCVTEL